MEILEGKRFVGLEPGLGARVWYICRILCAMLVSGSRLACRRRLKVVETSISQAAPSIGVLHRGIERTVAPISRRLPRAD